MITALGWSDHTKRTREARANVLRFLRDGPLRDALKEFAYLEREFAERAWDDGALFFAVGMTRLSHPDAFDPDVARELLTRSLDYTPRKQPVLATFAALTLAQMAWRDGDAELAASYAAKALHMAERAKDHPSLAALMLEAQLVGARASLRLGEPAEAAKVLETALRAHPTLALTVPSDDDLAAAPWPALLSALHADARARLDAVLDAGRTALQQVHDALSDDPDLKEYAADAIREARALRDALQPHLQARGYVPAAAAVTALAAAPVWHGAAPTRWDTAPSAACDVRLSVPPALDAARRGVAEARADLVSKITSVNPPALASDVQGELRAGYEAQTQAFLEARRAAVRAERPKLADLRAALKRLTADRQALAERADELRTHVRDEDEARRASQHKIRDTVALTAVLAAAGLFGWANELIYGQVLDGHGWPGWQAVALVAWPLFGVPVGMVVGYAIRSAFVPMEAWGAEGAKAAFGCGAALVGAVFIGGCLGEVTIGEAATYPWVIHLTSLALAAGPMLGGLGSKSSG